MRHIVNSSKKTIGDNLSEGIKRTGSAVTFISIPMFLGMIGYHAVMRDYRTMLILSINLYVIIQINKDLH